MRTSQLWIWLRAGQTAMEFRSGMRNLAPGNFYQGILKSKIHLAWKGMSINFGYHILHNDKKNSGAFALWDITARHNDNPNLVNLTTATGGKRIHTGPILVFYKKNIMLRTEYKFPLYEDVSGISNSRGNELNIGIGFAF